VNIQRGTYEQGATALLYLSVTVRHPVDGMDTGRCSGAITGSGITTPSQCSLSFCLGSYGLTNNGFCSGDFASVGMLT
jgi:hypothetical protein